MLLSSFLVKLVSKAERPNVMRFRSYRSLFSRLRHLFLKARLTAQTSKMAASHCCVPLCANDSRYNKDLSFHAFPTEDKRRAEWIVRIRRDPGRILKLVLILLLENVSFCVSLYSIFRRLPAGYIFVAVIYCLIFYDLVT